MRAEQGEIGQLAGIISAARELLDMKSSGELYRRAVELGRESLDLDRLGLLLYDAEGNAMIGTWGTDEYGRVTDESIFRQKVPADEGFIAESLRRDDYLAVWEDRDLTNGTKKVGEGWNAMAVLRDGNTIIGWLAADNLLRQRPLDGGERTRLVLYAQIVSNLIASFRRAEELEAGIARKTAELSKREQAMTALYRESDEQNSMKERLFTIVAHDLRGPMGTVKNLLAATIEEAAAFSDEEVRALIPEIHKSVDSVYGLLENLLDWVRSQMDEIKVLRERVDLEEVFMETISGQRATAEAKGVALELEVERGLSVFTDRRMVEAILRNFLSNAVKFTPSPRRARLRAIHSLEPAATRIEVVDEGQGMDERTLSLIFTMDGAKKRNGSSGERGNGLGLVFCADLAKRLGGEIVARSRPGSGSVFTLVLPDVYEEELPGVE